MAVHAAGDAGIGLGHVRRGLALAGELVEWCDVQFFLRGSAEAVTVINRAGFPGARVRDFKATLAEIAGAPAAALVVDSYEVGAHDYAAARTPGLLLIAVDDLNRGHLPVDMVVNPAPDAGKFAGADGIPRLLGPDFALLHREFATSAVRDIRPHIETVLLVLGGATPGALAAALARIIRHVLPASLIDVVVGPLGQGAVALSAELARLGNARIHTAPESLRPLMLAADLAVTGGGVTVFELAATGTPALGVELAPNQRQNLEGMAKAGTLVVAGKAGDTGLAEAVHRMVMALAADADRRRAMSERGRDIVDGRGAARVAEAIRTLLAERGARRKTSR